MADSDRVEQLLSSLRDDNEGLRNHAAAGLGQMGEAAIPKLIELFEDDDLRGALRGINERLGVPFVFCDVGWQ